MKITDLFQKVKSSVMDYYQMYLEAKAEAADWKEFPPEILHAVLENNKELAAKLYSRKTGASEHKAKMLIWKIRRDVHLYYPGILHDQACARDMEAIKTLWPFGREAILVFAVSEKEYKAGGNMVGRIKRFVLEPSGTGEYEFKKLTNNIDSEELVFDIIFRNNKIYLKDSEGNVTEMESFSFTSGGYFYTFDENSDLYKTFLERYNEANSLQSIIMYRTSDLEKFLTGKMDVDTLTNVADCYHLVFEDGKVKSEGINIAEELRRLFYRHNDEFFPSANWETPFSIRHDVYDYFDNYTVYYVNNDEQLKGQLSAIREHVDAPELKDPTYPNIWNSLVSQAEMVYSGWKNAIAESELCIELVSVDKDSGEMVFEIPQNTIFDHEGYKLYFDDTVEFRQKFKNFVDKYIFRLIVKPVDNLVSICLECNYDYLWHTGAFWSTFAEDVMFKSDKA